MTLYVMYIFLHTHMVTQLFPVEAVNFSVSMEEKSFR